MGAETPQILPSSQEVIPPKGGSIRATSLSVSAPTGKVLLDDISFEMPRGTFSTIIGLSGCGKTTLIRTLCGLIRPTSGQVLFSGHGISTIKSEYPLAVGYIPQFGTFHNKQSTRETLNDALQLRLPDSVPAPTRADWLAHVTELAGITRLLDQPLQTLSGGQMRRVALAEELLGDPSFLLLDELTTGLDVHSDGEMMDWLRQLAHEHGKTILLVTHNTGQLAKCDKVAFLHQGKLVHFDKCASLLAAESVDSIDKLFGKYSKIEAGAISAQPPPVDAGEPEMETLQTDLPPSGWQQFPTLAARQWRLFFRDWSQLGFHILLIVLFPLVVAVFALDGLPQVLAAVEGGSNIVKTLETRLLELKNSIEGASLVSGLVMFQVVLLTLLGANNGAREIAREREILSKELFAGLSPSAYLAAKLCHVAVLSVIQSLAMAWFVKTACGFPGPFLLQFGILATTTVAMSVTCLAISAASPSAERASLLSIYLVGFQLPLSGAALALPEWLASICQPFIAAYWGWSGYLRTLSETRYLRLVVDSTKTEIAGYGASMLVLCAHIVICAVIAYFMLRRIPKSTR